MTFGKEGETGDKSGSPGLSGETVLEEGNPGRSPTPAPGSDFPTVRKRKSGTFWRRKSSLGMASAFGANGDPEIRENGTTNGVTSSGSNVINGKQNGVSGEQNGMNSDYDGRTSMAEQENEKPLPDIAIASTRSWSPPPQLPELIGGGGGLGGEDLFKDIQ